MTTRQEQHANYYAHSDYYAFLTDNFGGSLPTSEAEIQALLHGLTLDGLAEDGDLTETDFEHDGEGARIRVHTLPFVMALGY